jgi:PhoPQ-activated pathogenicity-related protein
MPDVPDRPVRSSHSDARLRSRRRFALESLSTLAAGCLAAGEGQAAPGVSGVSGVSGKAAGVLADYALAVDPATRCEPVGDGEVAGGRYATCRLVSQTWRGAEWAHELSIYCPPDPASTETMLLWIDGGSAGKVPEAGKAAGPSDAVKTLAVFANAAGLPAAVVRQVPYQPMFDGLVEDDLIAHTFVEFARTGDASWPLLLPMVKAAVEAMTAAAEIARERFDLDVEGFVVTGASKRGWTTWLAAAVDDRVRAALPMVIDMLSMERHVELQFASFGKMSDKLEDYTSRGIEKLLQTPRGRELIGIVDPYRYRERITQPTLIALGSNDPYWPLESLDLYFDGLPGPRWVSYAPNAGHGLPPERIAGLVTALGRHAIGAERLPDLRWEFAATDKGVACTVRSDEPPTEILLWQAASPSRDFRQARWTSSAVAVPADGAAFWQAVAHRPAEGHAAAFVECHYARETVPLVLTTSVHVQAAG